MGKNRTGTVFLILFLILGIALIVYSYHSDKSGSTGISGMTSDIDPIYTDSDPDDPEQQPFENGQLDTIDSYASASGLQSSIIQPPMPDMGQKSIQDPSELLPKGGDNSQWSVVSPSGQGELSNINLLKAGYHSGINTVGTSLRNANLQLRSETPNPQIYNGPWNMSTITHDAIGQRPSLELGQGPQ